MRPQDKKHFLSAAQHFKFWILVRRTNINSLNYIGKPRYVPKRIDCKAKTASVNVGRYLLAGLVVSPEIHKQAFAGKKSESAQNYWNSMKPLLGRAYTVDMDVDSKHYGCLMLNGSYIHGDYDLKAIIDTKQTHRNLALVSELHGVPHNVGPNFILVKDYINQRIGTPMIQHGAEEQYADHSEESIDAFGPNGEDVTILNEFSMRHWYTEKFGNRQTIRTGI
jgi:hypothetical protein